MIRKIFRICVGFALAMIIASCGSTNQTTKGSEPVELKSKEVNFENKSGSLIVNNETSSEIVVFAGKVEKDNLLGGIHKNSTGTFDLSKISGIPASGSLLIRAASYEVYKGKARITEDDVVWTGLVVYNLQDSAYKAQISIFRGIDTEQKTCIYVSNISPNFVLELRKDTPSQGEIIATLPPLQRHKQIFLEQRSDGYGYDIYPTFIYVNPKTGEKTSMVGKAADAELVDPLPVGREINEYEFSGPSSSDIGYKVSFLNLSNNTKKGLEFRNGTAAFANQKGRRNTLSGRTDIYEIPSVNGESGQTYTGLTCRFPGDVKITLNPQKFLPGYVYEVNVTDVNGNYEYDIREVGKKSLVEDARISLFGE